MVGSRAASSRHLPYDAIVVVIGLIPASNRPLANVFRSILWPPSALVGLCDVAKCLKRSSSLFSGPYSCSSPEQSDAFCTPFSSFYTHATTISCHVVSLIDPDHWSRRHKPQTSDPISAAVFKQGLRPQFGSQLAPIYVGKETNAPIRPDSLTVRTSVS